MVPAAAGSDASPLGDLAGDTDLSGLMGRRDFSVLIVDDSAGLRDELRRLLGRLDVVATIQEAANGLEGYKKVLKAAPDLVLCDLVMPSVDGLKFVTLLRSRAELRDLPVILLTGKTDVETKIRGLELGASDYVTKPFEPGELLARIKVQLKIKALQDELRRSNERLRELSSTDPLTHLFNRRYFMNVLVRECERTGRYDEPLSFVLFDIDHFKGFNDTHGHQAGDDALVEVAKLLAAEVRTQDIPGRYGGEEFCAILPHTALAGALEFADRFRQRVAAREFVVKGQPFHLTISVGISTCPGRAAAGADDLIRLADEALYRAKTAGRNRVMVSET